MTKKPHIWVLVIDDTHAWSGTPEILARTGRIFSVWLYDSTAHVHLCELTPSYELWYVDFVCEKEIDDDTWDDVSDGYDSGERVSYIHTLEINSARVMKVPGTHEWPGFLEKGERMGRFQYLTPDEFPDDWVEEPSLMEDVVQGARENAVY